jgi:cobalt-zinc-cadmium efflux system outer membrane protein
MTKTRSSFFIGVLVVGLTAAAGPLQAQDPEELHALIREALEKNPELAAARGEAEAARARVAPAGALPDPMVSVSYENDGTTPSLGTEPMTRLQFIAQQAFPFPGKLGLSERVAKLDAERAATRPERVALTLEAAVRRAYADLLEAREDLRLMEEQLQTWHDIADVTRARYTAGMGTQQDVLRAQSERTRLLQQRRRDEGAERSAVSALRQLLYRTVEGPLATERRLTPGSVLAVPSPTEALARALKVTPELKEAGLAVERAKRATDLARRNLRPDFVASAAYMNRGGLPLMWSAGVGVSIPLWAGRKQRPLIVEAETLGEAASATENSLRRQIQARTEERLIRLEQLAAEAKLDAEGVLVQDRLSVDAALASYRTGAVPFVTVLEALGTYFIDRRAAVSRLAGFIRAEADLRELSLGRGATAAMAPSPGPSFGTAASRM